MNESRLERRARELAEEWHKDKSDKSGLPYVGHLGRVAEHAGRLVLTNSPYATVAAVKAREASAAGWLHDILEDTGVPWPVVMASVPPSVGRAVMALSHLPGEPWIDYMSRIADDRDLAPWVKWADMADNQDPARVALVRGHDVEAWKRLVENGPRRLDQFRRVMAARRIEGPWAQ